MIAAWVAKGRSLTVYYEQGLAADGYRVPIFFMCVDKLTTLTREFFCMFRIKRRCKATVSLQFDLQVQDEARRPRYPTTYPRYVASTTKIPREKCTLGLHLTLYRNMKYLKD